MTRIYGLHCNTLLWFVYVFGSSSPIITIPQSVAYVYSIDDYAQRSVAAVGVRMLCAMAKAMAHDL